MILNGKKIIVTGGAKGMGASIVRAFTEQGAHVASLDLDAVCGPAVAAQATDAGPGQAFFQHCDVSQADDVERTFATVAQALGGIDALVHAAGIAPGAAAEKITLDDWNKVFTVNATGTFLTNQKVFPYLKEKGGRIINFASGAGVRGLPGKAHYSATKGAVLAWTRTVAQEWGRYNITVNAICPAIWTPMYDLTRSNMAPAQLAEHDADMARRIPLGGKLGDPMQDLAPALVFYASDGARFITGQTLVIDGGMLILT